MTYRCPDCAGKGWVLKDDEIDDGPWARPDCASCRGTGELEAERAMALARKYLNAEATR